jgi:hypothetical protein
MQEELWGGYSPNSAVEPYDDDDDNGTLHALDFRGENEYCGHVVTCGPNTDDRILPHGLRP